MGPKILSILTKSLIGIRTNISFAENRTPELWRQFMPRRKEIKNNAGDDLYSIEVYDNLSFFKNFNPHKEFEKWAAVEVSDFDFVPEKMETLIIPEGLYAVFNYKGKASEAASFYQEIFTKWFPDSDYVLDNRPHFAKMGEKYKHDHPDSEEEIWIPVKKKD